MISAVLRCPGNDLTQSAVSLDVLSNWCTLERRVISEDALLTAPNYYCQYQNDFCSFIRCRAAMWASLLIRWMWRAKSLQTVSPWPATVEELMWARTLQDGTGWRTLCGQIMKSNRRGLSECFIECGQQSHCRQCLHDPQLLKNLCELECRVISEDTLLAAPNYYCQHQNDFCRFKMPGQRFEPVCCFIGCFDSVSMTHNCWRIDVG